MFDPIDSARDAGLRYVSDSTPGIRRRRNGSGFCYLDASGERIKEEATLSRIRGIVIPPAWNDVWISPVANGHIQATGRDSRGRKQYRYHPRWREVRDSNKFERLYDFAQTLPEIRKQIKAHLANPSLTREKVLASIVRLLDLTGIRIGNEEYRRANNSYGLTTLRNHHLRISGDQIKLRFRGKGGKVHDVKLQDRRVAGVLKRCQEIPGYELFQYLNESGDGVSIDSADVNEYLRTIASRNFTAKDFRTWAATVLAAKGLGDRPYTTQKEAKKNVVRVIENVAEALRNTPAICRKSYIHPLILDGYTTGTLSTNGSRKNYRASNGLSREEVFVLRFLKTNQQKTRKAA